MTAKSTSKLRGKFLMAMQEQVQGNQDKSVDAHKVGAQLGLSNTETEAVCQHLAEKGWVRFERSRAGPGAGGWVRITGAGFEEIERLMTPWWWQLLTDRVVLAAILAAIIASILSAFFSWLFGLL